MSLAPIRTPQRVSSTASTIERRDASQPTTARRGVPSGEGETSAWISQSTGRVPSMPAKTADPAASRSRWSRKSAEGFATSLRPSDLAVLGHVADEDDGGAGFLRKACQGLRRGADLRDGAGRRIDAIGPQ